MRDKNTLKEGIVPSSLYVPCLYLMDPVLIPSLLQPCLTLNTLSGKSRFELILITLSLIKTIRGYHSQFPCVSYRAPLFSCTWSTPVDEPTSSFELANSPNKSSRTPW